MTGKELRSIYNRMLFIIPGMLLCLIGDYCMGIEPKDSTVISGMISSGWLSIADWRIAVSNIGGLIGTLIHNFNVLYEAAGKNTELAVAMWNRSYMVQIVPYWVTFFAFELTVLIGWTGLILRGTFGLKKTWILASPLVVAGIGYLIEIIIPWQFNGFCSGFESFGWIVMFFGARKLVGQEIKDRGGVKICF